MFWNFVVICQNIFQHFFAHSHSIIFYTNVYIIVFLFPGYYNSSIIVFIHMSDSVIDCIFQNRLDDQLYNTVIIKFFIYLKIYLKSFFIAYQLNIHITTAMLKFILDWNNRLAPWQADSQQFCKLRNHNDRFSILLCFYHPGDRLQRIIKKMWIDLTLKRIQFTFSPLVLLTHNFFHQLFNLFIWFLHGMSKMSYFQRSPDINIRFFSGFISLHRSI